MATLRGIKGSQALFHAVVSRSVEGQFVRVISSASWPATSPCSTTASVVKHKQIQELVRNISSSKVVWQEGGSANADEASSSYSTDLTDPKGVEIVYFRGLPVFTIPLPSRKERCRLIVKPLTNTVGDLMNMIKEEDKGIDRVVFLASQDGIRIGASNTIEMLMEHDFDLVINDIVYNVETPYQEKPSETEVERLSSVRNLVGQLYAALNVDEHQLRLEREMMTELEKLQLEVTPLEEKCRMASELAQKRTNVLSWVGLGLMSVQFGILARLTWWEYSWDIMEPVTYFVTYGTAMLAYAYFVLTKQEYILPDVKDRQYLFVFHKHAKKVGLDVEKYNQLKDKIDKIQKDLHRVRDPLALQLPKARLGQVNPGLTSQDSSYFNLLQKVQSMLKKPGGHFQ